MAERNLNRLLVVFFAFFVAAGSGHAATVSYTGNSLSSPLVPLFDPIKGKLNEVIIEYTVAGLVELSLFGNGTDQDLLDLSLSGELTGKLESSQIPSLVDLVAIPYSDSRTIPSPGPGEPFQIFASTPLQVSEIVESLEPPPFLDVNNFVGTGLYTLEFTLLQNNSTCDGPAFLTRCQGIGRVGELAYTVIYDFTEANVSPVPLPAAGWLFASALIGLIGSNRRKSTIT